MTTMTKVELVLDGQTTDWLGLIADHPELGARYALGSAPTLWHSLLEDAASRLQLTAGEAKAILDACNGLLLIEGLAGQHLELEMRDAFRLNSLDAKWGTDPDFLDRLHLLSRGERWAIEIWAGAFWVHGDPERYPGGRYNDSDFERQHLALVVRREVRTDPPGVEGRPRRAGTASLARLEIKLTEDELGHLRELAEKAGLNVSEYVRRRVL